jgi:hypothetical protein
MEHNDNVNEELDGITPTFPKKQPVGPPVGYFEAFPDRVLNRWKKETSQPVRRSITWKWIGIAAVTTGLILGGIWLIPRSVSNGMREITAVEAYQYINENIGEFESIIESGGIKTDDTWSDLPSGAIEDYLLKEMEGTDPEDLF